MFQLTKVADGILPWNFSFPCDQNIFLGNHKAEILRMFNAK